MNYKIKSINQEKILPVFKICYVVFQCCSMSAAILTKIFARMRYQA